MDRKATALDVTELLESLEEQQPPPSVPKEFLEGTFELVFSSAVKELPFVGMFYDGYMPSKEIMNFNFTAGEMTLTVETLPLMPQIDIVGDKLTWDPEKATLSYIIEGREEMPPSTWQILYASEHVLAARSSVTGLNVVRRIEAPSKR